MSQRGTPRVAPATFRNCFPDFDPVPVGLQTGPMEQTRNETFVHPSADVEAGATLGAGTKVWHLAHVRSSAVVIVSRTVTTPS